MQSNQFPLIAILKASLCALALAIVLVALWKYAPRSPTIQTFSAERHADPPPATLASSPARHSSIKDFTTVRRVVVLSGWVGRGAPWSIEYEMKRNGDHYLGETHMDDSAKQLAPKEQVKHRFSVPATVMDPLLRDLSKFEEVAASETGQFGSDNYPYLRVMVEFDDEAIEFVPSDLVHGNGQISGNARTIITRPETVDRLIAGLTPHVGIQSPGGVKTVVSGNSNADAPYVILVSYGRYAPNKTDWSSAEQQAWGKVESTSGQMHLIEETTRIPCRIGEHWGFEFQLRNAPSDRPFEYRSEMHHPPIRQPDGQVVTVSAYNKTVKPGDVLTSAETWTFVPFYKHKLVSGTWTKQLFVDGKKVFEKSFEVVAEHPSPPLSASPKIETRYVLKPSGGGGVIFDTPGSQLKIGINPQTKQTSLFGLTFTEECTATVLADRTLGVDKAGIVVRDQAGKTWKSMPVTLNGQQVICFFPIP